MTAPGFPDNYTQLWAHTRIGDILDADAVYPAGLTADSPLEELLESAMSDGSSGAPVVVSGTTDTLAAADAGATVRYTNAGLVTVAIPTDAADDLADGFWCLLFAEGAGGLTLSTTGVTLAGSSPNTTVAQNEALLVQKTGSANTWIVLGGTA